jgi:hypothetical protein
MGKIRAATMKSLQKQGMTATGMLSSMGGTPINSSDIKPSIDDFSKMTPTANVVDISAKDGDKEKEKEDSKFEFKMSEDQAVAGVDMSGGTADRSTPNYDIDSKEINGQNGPSIFELISIRYLKSAYPKLLEEEPVKN